MTGASVLHITHRVMMIPFAPSELIIAGELSLPKLIRAVLWIS